MKATGAEVLAFGKHLDKDADVVPDRVVGDGDSIDGTEFGLDVLHTPGHAPNHLCFFLEEERMLFTGDTVLDGMCSVVNPQPRRRHDDVPRVARRGCASSRISRICARATATSSTSRRCASDEYIEHRKQREQQILRW